MIIVFCVEDKNLEAKISERAARSPYLLILEIEDNKIKRIEFVENKFKDLLKGAGPKFGQFLIEIGAKKLVAGNVGPNLELILKEAGIEFIKAENKRVIDILKEWKLL